MKASRNLIQSLLLGVAMLPMAVQAQFVFVSTNNVITITGFAGSNGTVVIPKKIAGLPVAIIGTSAFASLTNLTSVTLPDNVATISSSAFYNCTSLTNVTLGNGVTTIGDYAFEYCSNLSNVTMPASLQSLGNYAFAFCTSLNGAYFQGNALFVSGSQFYSDSHAVVYYLPWTTGWGQTFANLPTAPYVPPVPFNYTTNNGVITITGYTGSNSMATVPDKIYVTGISNFLPVTSIGTNAFAGCSSLFTVVVPGGVTNIGDLAFYDCTNLVGAFFGGNAPNPNFQSWDFHTAFSNDENAIVYYLPGTTGWHSTFGYAPTVQLPYIYSITNGTIAIRSYTGSSGAVAIPGMVGGLPVASIGNGAFAYCGSLTNVTMPSSVTDIGNGSFAFCSGLTSVTITDSVTDIGIYAFYACSNLAEVTISTNVTNIGISAFDSCSSLTNVNIPDGVAIIGGSAFQNCVSLDSVAIPASVASIGQYAFDSCGSLEAIKVDPQNTNFSSLDGILLNGNQTTLIQYPGGKAGNYTIPNSVTSIGNFAFDSCTGLTSVAISSSIGDWAFSGCSGLNKVTIANGIINIGCYAFEFCSSLTTVTIPDSITTIGKHTFDDCTGLTDVTIGFGLISLPSRIGSGSFSDCPNLTSIYLRGSNPYFVWNPTNAVATPTAYYLPSAAIAPPPPGVTGLPTTPWLPRALTADGGFGFQTNQFGFNISWASGWTVALDACTDLAQAAWSPVDTITITNGMTYFGDSQWTNYPNRFYRIRGLGMQQ